MRIPKRFLSIALAHAPVVAMGTASSTVTHLQAAFEAELNASQTWKAFARGAEREGLHGVARLFEALATADGVHAQNHAEVLRALGAPPRATVTEVEARSTRANLQEAIARETFGRDGAYPTWIAAAREVGDPTPLSTLRIAMWTERSHVEMLEKALRDLDRPAAAALELCVSPRSGHVAACPDARP
jgi:rubrerythrin